MAKTAGQRADSAISRITNIRAIWEAPDGSEHVRTGFETAGEAKKAIPKSAVDWVILGIQYHAVKVLRRKRVYRKKLTTRNRLRIR